MRLISVAYTYPVDRSLESLVPPNSWAKDLEPCVNKGRVRRVIQLFNQ